MSPAEDSVIQAAMGLIDPQLRLQFGVVRVRVGRKGIGVDDLSGELAPDDECIADDVPLPLGAKEAEELAEVMDEPGELHPVGLAVPPDRLGRLEEVLDLTDGRVWVRLVDERVEHLECLPDGHAGVDLAEDLFPDRQIVRERLLLVLLLADQLSLRMDISWLTA